MLGIFKNERWRNREKEGGEMREKERERVRVKGGGGNLISVLIKPNLFWRATETALCHYADQQGWGEVECPSLILLE